MKKEYIQGVSDANLIQMAANAFVTYFKLQGSQRARMNQTRYNLYVDELIRRDLPGYSMDRLLEFGVFQGEGSI